MSEVRFQRELRHHAGALLALALALGQSGASASVLPSPAELTISVETGGGGAIEGERYVAVVPIREPLSAPYAEALLDGSDGSIPAYRVQVPAGSYRVVCSALGHGFEILPPVEASPGARLEVTCRLPRLTEVRGSVYDREQGTPIEGATVGFASRFLYGYAGRLSPIGESHLRRNYVRTTDSGGGFVLPAIPEYRSNLVVLAEGYAPLYLRDVEFPASTLDLGRLSLEPGGSLEIDLDIPESFPRDRYKVLLERVDRSWQAPSTLWQRALEDGELTWSGVPAGEFRLWVKGSSLGNHGDEPFEFGPFEVEAGGLTRIAFELPPLPAIPKEEKNLPPLRLLLSDGLDVEVLEILAIAPGGETEATAFERVPLAEGSRLDIEDGCGLGWSYSVRHHSSIFRTLRIERPEDCERVHTLERLPAAKVRGRLSPPFAHRPPEVALLWAETCDRDGRRKAGSLLGPFPVEVEESSGTWEARLPAICLRRPTLWSPQFAPLEWPEVRLEPGAQEDLGSRELELGAALLVRVVAREDRLGIGQARVEVVGERDWPDLAAALVRGEPLHGHGQRGWTSERGWTRLPGLLPGRIFVRATTPDGEIGFVGQLEIDPGGEWVLDELETSAPASLTVDVRSSDFAGRQMVEVKPQLTCGTPREASLIRGLESGPGRFEGLLAGSWDVVAYSVGGPGDRAQLLDRRVVDLAPGEDGWLKLDRAEITFRGRVLLGAAPHATDLRLLRIEPEGTGVWIEAHSDEEGSFEVSLPSAGIYEVKVGARPARDQSVGRVRFDDPAREVVIQLANTSVDGRVVDTEGEPVTGAQVVALFFGSEPVAVTRHALGSTDSAGEFRFTGLEPGPWRIAASHRQLQTRGYEIELEKDEDVSLGAMPLAPPVALEGIVTSPRGFRVSSGVVAALAVPGNDDVHAIEVVDFLSPDGSFSLELPPGSGDADVAGLVLVEGHPATPFDLESGREVRLAAVGGSAVMSSEDEQTSLWLLGRGPRALVSLYHLYAARENSHGRREKDGRRLTLTSLAPGEWWIYPARSAAERERAIRSAGRPRGAISFQISPGSTTPVEIEPLPEE